MEPIMRFANLTAEQLVKNIQNLGASCHWMFGTVFYSIYPKQNKVMGLKEEYKPQSSAPGIYTEYHQVKKRDADLVQRAKDKMRAQQFFGQQYDHPEASLKLHISINNIADLDEEVIMGLINLLKEESESPDNNLNFHFKIIDPARVSLERFKMNDQLTIYFDKYSSTADLIRLADKVDGYLKKHVKVNEQPLGPKDSCGLNSFVSARFDTNKLLAEYDVYPFFDLELKKFLEQHTPEELEKLPLCAFEAVFNTVISSPDISIPKSGEKTGLSDEDSKKVALEFEIMLRDPKKYMSDVKNTDRQHVIAKAKDKAKEEMLEQVKKGEKLQFDFATIVDLEKLKLDIVTKRGQMEGIAKTPHQQAHFNILDSQVLDKFGTFIGGKESQFNQAIDSIMDRLDVKANEKLQLELEKYKIIPPKLNPQAVQNFETLLNELKVKSKQLKAKGNEEKALHAKNLYKELSHAFSLYQKGYSDYTTFERNCDNAIKKVMPFLEKHSGFKEILVNLWEAIKTLGGSLYREHQKSGGQRWFFRVPTASEELANKIKEPIKDLQDENVEGASKKTLGKD